ncbi:MAG TPA: biotin/lipoyl-binding protein [Kofleriaceae bacterium]|nr:biotin/lipoyl-binding protein [Kofleriaceae bacterium]
MAEAPKAPEFVAVITSRKSQLITAPFEGTIMKLQARNGKEVTEGDIVAEIDDTKLKHDLDQAKGQLEQAKGVAAKAGALVANARRRAMTERRLINSGAAAPEAFRNIQAEASSYGAEGASAAGQIKSAKAMIADLEGQLAKAKVPAPFAGTLSVVKVKEGQAARRGEPIARVFDPKELIIAFAVPAAYKKTVKVNTNVEFVTDEGKVVPATIRTAMDDHDPTIEFTTFEAVIDPTYRTDEIRVGDNGHVRIAGAVR